jgi:hypothetical protein
MKRSPANPAVKKNIGPGRQKRLAVAMGLRKTAGIIEIAGALAHELGYEAPTTKAGARALLNSKSALTIRG